METWIKQGLLLTILLPPCVFADVMCHLHAPADYKTFSRQPLVIPAVGLPAECDQLNQRRFENRGRCHCINEDLNSSSPYINDTFPDDPSPEMMF